MCQLWFKYELKLVEDDRSHLVTLDGKQLVLLKSKEAVASKITQIQPAVQILIAQSVNAVLGKWEASEHQTPLVRPIGVKAGDEAKLEYFPFELRADYVPVRVLGVGSFGVVLLAKFVKDGHHKYSEAIKLVFSGGGPTGFSDKALRRLEREATILGRLSNPHIVRLRSYGVSASREVFWLIMEHLDGSSLDVIMQDGDLVFTEEGTVRLALQMLTALDDLHKMGVVHRDVKPQNIVECADSYKLIDVGAAAVVDVRAEEVGQSLATQGTVLNFAGTHGFMPPEAYRDPTQVGPHSDLFALAATVFYLLSRQMPFQAENEWGWMFAVAGNMEEQAPRLVDLCPGVSPGLSDIIAKGLHKKISDRYSSAMEMKSDLEQLMQSKYSAIFQLFPSHWKKMSSPWQDVELVQLQTS